MLAPPLSPQHYALTWSAEHPPTAWPSGLPREDWTLPEVWPPTADNEAVLTAYGATHGMGAGIGGGRWAPGLAEAAFEAGYDLWLPAWTPDGMERGRPRVEPDISYPVAPPALVIAWNGADGSRVLLRQAPAPLASPDGGGRDAEEVDIEGVTGVLRGRMLVTLVWEAPERAFGLQVRGLPDSRDVALRVARSISPRTPA